MLLAQGLGHWPVSFMRPRGQRVEMMPLKLFRWAGSGQPCILLSTLAPLPPVHEEQPRLPRGGDTAPSPSLVLPCHPQPQTEQLMPRLLSVLLMQAEQMEKCYLFLASYIVCSIFPWMRLSQHLLLPVPGWAATAVVTPGTSRSMQSSCWDSSARRFNCRNKFICQQSGQFMLVAGSLFFVMPFP